MTRGNDEDVNGAVTEVGTAEAESGLQVAVEVPPSDDPRTVPQESDTEGSQGLEVAPPADDLARQLTLALADAAELREQLLRRKAEFDNYRRRVDRERQQAAEEARAEVIREFLPALDNLERAQRLGGDEDSIRQGVEMIYAELQKALARLDVRSHEPVGESFDPLSQQALLYEEVPGFTDGTVVEVYRRSYHLSDRLLRPAMVKVAKGAESVDGRSGEGA